MAVAAFADVMTAAFAALEESCQKIYVFPGPFSETVPGHFYAQHLIGFLPKLLINESRMGALVKFVAVSYVALVKGILDEPGYGLFAPYFIARCFYFPAYQFIGYIIKRLIVSGHFPDKTYLRSYIRIDDYFLRLSSIRQRISVGYQFIAERHVASHPFTLSYSGYAGGLHALADELPLEGR